jgi:hypothetical protein
VFLKLVYWQYIAHIRFRGQAGYLDPQIECTVVVVMTELGIRKMSNRATLSAIEIAAGPAQSAYIQR